ncbi:MAG: ABC transporter permease [Anaerolineaceae bacterium]|nr:ABC transporter permease [Anaerolineaceae bacterium]
MNISQVRSRVSAQPVAIRESHADVIGKPRVPSRLPLRFVIGLGMLLVVVTAALFADHLAPYDMAALNPAASLQAPSAAHLFGTDLFGRDLFSRVLYGSRLSLAVALLAVTVAALPGMLLGMIAGLYSGVVSDSLAFLMDAWLVVPGLLFVIALATTFGRTTIVLGFALGIAGIPLYFRQTRSETLRVRSELFIEAAWSLGANPLHILIHHILPNVLPTMVVVITIQAGGILLAVSAFNFIGLGAQPPEPEWGTLLADGRDYLQTAGWLTFFPGVAIALTVLGLNLLGDGLRDLLDPHNGQ